MVDRVRMISGRCSRVTYLPVLCLIVLLIAAPLSAAAPETDPITTEASGADGPSTAVEKPSRQSRQRAVTVAVYLLGGIVFAGLALVALAALWGHHVRRIVRKPRPRQSHTDEFWYLRPKKELGKKQESEPEDSGENGEEAQTP